MNAELMQKQLAELLDPSDEPMTNLANAAAFLNGWMDDLNWIGFYLLRGDTLVLGPFQGRIACTRIAPGRGVCGAAFSENRVLRVPDVHEFPGHIACDPLSRSELVLPLCGADGTPFGVLDLDSESLNRFSEADEALLTKAAALIAGRIAEARS